MKTLLLMMIFGIGGWEPQYVVSYPDQTSCLKAEAKDYKVVPTIGNTKTVCIPQVLYKEGK